MAKKKQKKTKAAAKKSARKVVKLAAARKAKSKTNGKQGGQQHALPRASREPHGQDGKALTGVRDPRLSCTHVQSVPDLHAASRLARR